MTITFCGHRNIEHQAAISRWLDSILPSLIAGGAATFYLGGYGAFDELAAEAVRRQKAVYPNIKSVLVLPYENQSINVSPYDKVIYPISGEVPPRHAIIERNRWMVQKADVVISGVSHNGGGAARTLEYASLNRKVVLQYPAERKGA